LADAELSNRNAEMSTWLQEGAIFLSMLVHDKHMVNPRIALILLCAGVIATPNTAYFSTVAACRRREIRRFTLGDD